MLFPSCQRSRAGMTVIELLCVIAIILVLAGLLLGPASRILQRVRADQWANRAEIHLQETVEQLQKHCRARPDFPPLTLERIQSEKLLGSAELDFLKDRRVTFTPFAGLDSDDMIVIRVELQRGNWTEAGVLTRTKGDMAKLPQ
jgi:prepilin-type N-terminal cleavage/methylation domain-containing protein